MFSLIVLLGQMLISRLLSFPTYSFLHYKIEGTKTSSEYRHFKPINH